MPALYSDSLYRCFSDIENNMTSGKRPDVFFGYNNTIQGGGFSRLSLKVDLNTTDGYVEIPCYGKYEILNELNKFDRENRYSNNKAPIVYYPIMNNYCADTARHNYAKNEYKSAAPAIQAFFLKTPLDLGVRHMACGTHNTYWGGRGLILYEDLTPMVMFSIIFKKTEVNSTYIPDYKVPGYEVAIPVVRINPVVFYRDDILSKHIRGKMLTELLACREDLFNTRHQTFGRNISYVVGGFDYRKLRIIIEDFSYFFEKPQAPSAGITNDELNAFALENYKEILQVQ